jgi:hypothetical protein
MAVSSYYARKTWLITLMSMSHNAMNVWHHSHSSLMWVVSKSICVTQILSAAYLISHSKLSATIATQLHVVKNSKLPIGEERKYIESIDLIEREGTTDISLSALGYGFDQLQAINLKGCQGVTDIAILASCYGCRQLRSIDISDCQGITDIGCQHWLLAVVC